MEVKPSLENDDSKVSIQISRSHLPETLPDASPNPVQADMKTFLREADKRKDKVTDDGLIEAWVSICSKELPHKIPNFEFSEKSMNSIHTQLREFLKVHELRKSTVPKETFMFVSMFMQIDDEDTDRLVKYLEKRVLEL